MSPAGAIAASGERSADAPCPGQCPPPGPPAAEPLRTRFHRGVFWSAAAAVATSGSNFAVNVVVARLLGREGYGEFGMVLSTTATVAGIAQLAMGYTTTKFVAEHRSADPARAGRIIGLSSVVSTVTASVAAAGLLLGASWLAASSLAAPELAGSLRLASAMVFFVVLSGYQMGALAGLESYRRLAVLAVGTGAMNLLGAAGGAAVSGLDGAVAGMGAGALAQWLMLRSAVASACAEQGLVVCRQGALSERTVLFTFALPAALSGLSSMPALWLSNAFLVRQAGGFSELALYAAAFSVRSFVFFLPNLINRVSMSLLNNQKGAGDWEGFRRMFWTNVGLTATSVTLAALAVGLVGAPLLAIFGREFRVAGPVLTVLLAATVLEAVMASMYQIVQAESRMWSSLFLIVLPRDVLMVVLASVLCPRLGALGLAIAYGGGWMTACLATGVLAARLRPARRAQTAVGRP